MENGVNFCGRYLSEHFSNPGAPDGIPHALSIAALELGAQPQGKELLDDLALRLYGRCRAGSATSGVLHGEVKRCGPGYIFQRWVTAGSKKTAHGGSAPRSHG